MLFDVRSTHNYGEKRPITHAAFCCNDSGEFDNQQTYRRGLLVAAVSSGYRAVGRRLQALAIRRI